MFKELLTQVQNKYKEKLEENEKYKELLNKVNILPKFYNYSHTLNNKLTISYKLLMDICPDLNENDAIILREVIPIDELILSCIYANECKTNVKFYFIATTKYLWLVNKEGHLKYNYQDLTIEVIKNSMLSKTVLLSNMLFNINGSNEMLLSFIKLFQDSNYREDEINKKLEILCNTIPRIFYLNSLASGISISINNEIVFHTKVFHYKYNIKDIKNYELLLDNTVVEEKKSNHRNRITANKNSCYEMMLRITTDNNTFFIPILEKNTFSALYSSTSKEFRESREFASNIINLLDDLDNKLLNGEL
ncbi:MAG TPA: hypothetical protein IAB59_02125 [Candidatus Onthousia faecipullorum]|uniref:Uncharacterized protein n=1 Tax=Candidatus Onthousia faecipullorum TaxID=2840887 RepID=A0A9D1GAL6_9FIRM|nr:hypothetical protein [Candidatus Onthousia faecipullorum]